MIEFWKADLRDCPPTVVLCRVAFRLASNKYQVNPLQFANAPAGLRLLANQLGRDGWPGLAASVAQASDYIRIRKRKLALWRFDVCRSAGKAILRSRDRRLCAYEKDYPRITNRGVVFPCSWLEDLPETLKDLPCGRYGVQR